MYEFGREEGGVGGWRVEGRVWRGRGSIEGYIHTQPSLLCAQLEVSLASGSAGLSQVAHDQEVDCSGQQLCWEIGYLHGVAGEEGASRGLQCARSSRPPSTSTT